MSNMLQSILGRADSFVRGDIKQHERELSERISNARVLVIGAAGSIGGSFVNELAGYRPAGLHLVDISENNLVEVVRNLRSSGKRLPEDFRTYAIDFTQPEFHSLLRHESYDFVLNFSALKHVRSERDPYTLMRLLQVNVVANEKLVSLLDGSSTKRIFSVSTDKSVRPANLMGASKAFMERVFLARADSMPFSSARFANVAFSDGSLLHSFRMRLEKRQPICAPVDVRRYFISHEEAGHLCLIGCFLVGNREVVFPKFEPTKDMLSFADIARTFLDFHGLKPIECDSEEQSLQMAQGLDGDSRAWPCFFSESDTTGEKPYEEFVSEQEPVDSDRFENVGVITAPLFHDVESLELALASINNLMTAGSWTIEQIRNAISIAVPELNHLSASRNLDQKM